MNGTFFSSGLLNTPAGLTAALLIGAVFGLILEQAGFASSRRLTGVFYLRDMTVVKVMFMAVVTTLIGYQYVVAAGWLAPSDIYILETWWGAQIAGGLLFGVGFVMGGFCPGTALAGLASLKGDAAVFLVGTILGSVLFNEAFPVVRPLYEGFHAGPVSLAGVLGLSMRAWALLFTLAAVAVFAVSTVVERRAGFLPAPAPESGLRNRRLALLLVLAALGIFLLPGGVSPPLAAATSGKGSEAGPAPEAGQQALVAAVASGGDHIDPDDLADWLMKGGAGLRLIDLRSPVDFESFHIRGAWNIPLESLTGDAAQFPKDTWLVLYSNGTTHAAQAWLLLRQAGYGQVRVLTDGIVGFWRDCLTPPSLMPESDEAAARAAGPAFRSRRSFFLDNARQPLPPPAAPAPVAATARAASGDYRRLEAAGLEQGLVTAGWLAAHLGQPGLVVLDVRAKSTDYTISHIQGAFYLNYENIRGTVEGIPNTVLPAADLARIFGRLGIETGNTVVVYSDQLRDSTLVALALERVGSVLPAVLHGGWGNWKAEGLPVDKSLPTPRESRLQPRAGADTFTASLEEVKRASESGPAVILDVRPADYYAGKKTDEMRAGHIPGALNREFVKDLVPDSAFWLDETSLRESYARLGIGRDTPVIVHCRTGHQASQVWYVLTHVLGVKNVKWFDGSWLAWASDPSLPVELSP